MASDVRWTSGLAHAIAPKHPAHRPHQWTVRQSLLGVDEDEEEGGSWENEGRIDLRADTNPTGPIVTLVAIRG